MTLTLGTRLGPYEIVAAAGAGGMGEVYRATDTALKRTVALKVLPASMAGDADRLARFQREAEVLASLNHPSIAAIYGLASADGVNALVMEFVEGPTLADCINQGAIPLDDALPIATQIAEALEAAHERGIIHRDLKPANIKVRADGVVKVLDFGLAKALDSNAGSGAAKATPYEGTGGATPYEAPTMTSPAMTQLGMILGTASYMSPEQARGKPVDRRADVWAFGCVLYEMLTGRRAFAGEEITDVIAAVVTRDPDLTALPAATPANVRTVLRRCFLKDPRQRPRDIGDLRLLLLEPSEPAPALAAPHARARRSPLVVPLAAALVIVSGTLAATLLRPRAVEDAAPVRMSITFPERANLQKGQPQPSLAFSRDGRTIVYTASGPEGNQLWIRDLNEFAPKPIPGTNGGRHAFFSPDGKWIGFTTGNTIKKVPISLGTPAVVCTFESTPRGATWTDAGEIVFATFVALWRVPENGGAPVRIIEGDLAYPDALPGGKAVVLTMDNEAADQTSGDLTIAAVTLGDGAVRKLFDGGVYARYVPTGHIAYLRDNAIMAAPFSPATLAVGEARVAMVNDAFMDHGVMSGNFAVSTAGALAYVPGAASDFDRTIITIDGLGAGTPNRTLISAPRSYTHPRVSPNGRLVAAPTSAWRDRIWIVDLARQTFNRLTSTDLQSETNPVWSPDSKTIVFSGVSDDAGPALYRVAIDGTNVAERLSTGTEVAAPTSWSPDGRSVVYYVRQPNGDLDLMLLSLEGTPTARPLLKTQFSESAAAISPDGNLIAYQSNQSGRVEIYVAAFPAMGSASRVSINGGQSPVWAKKGRRLYFRSSLQRVMASDVTGSTPSTPTEVATYPFVIPTGVVDTMPDGRLLAIDGPNIGSNPELRVILNWARELKDKVK